MKNKILLVTLIFTGLLSGCSSDYVLQTKSGEMIVTKGKPETDKSTGLVTYRDAGGYKHEINRNQISGMIEK